MLQVLSGITGIKVNEATAADTAKALKKDNNNLIGSDSNEWTVTANGIKMFSVKRYHLLMVDSLEMVLV